jgi:tetratricopeptide (TPR) repeat protein
MAAVLLISGIAPARADDASACGDAEGKETIAACDRVITQNPDDAVAWFNRGAAYLNQRQSDRAIADLDRAITLDPKQAAAYDKRGYAYNLKGEYDRGIIDLDRAISIDPTRADAWFDRCWAYNGKNDYDRAIADCEQVVSIGAAGFLAHCDPDAFILSKELAVVNDYMAACHTEIAFKAKRPEEPSVAARTLNYKIEAYVGRALAYTLKGEYDRAVADLDQAILMRPQYTSAWARRCWVYNAKREYDRAIADCDEAFRLSPDRFGLSHCAETFPVDGVAGYERDLAIGLCGIAIRRDPKNAAAYVHRGNAYNGKNEYQRAIADYDQALSIDPSLAEARQGRDRARAALAARRGR